MHKAKLIDKIEKRGDLPHVSAKRQLELLEQLDSFALGKYLIANGGINGYWTHYVITPRPVEHPLEDFLLNKAPVLLATQERYLIFKREVKKRLREGLSLACIPSGLMGVYLELDFSTLEDFELHAIDIDAEALELAKDYAKAKGLLQHCHFTQKDAWHLDVSEKFDLITSNGLTIYEPDDERVTELYSQFSRSLKTGGTLIASFLTPPPVWDQKRINPADMLLQRVLLADIIDAKWQSYRTEETVRNQLQKAGFHELEFYYDEGRVFPTVIAKKIN